MYGTSAPRSKSTLNAPSSYGETRAFVVSTSYQFHYRLGVATKVAIALYDDAYVSVQVCSAALGRSLAVWLSNAVQAAARRRNAAAYIAWDAAWPTSAEHDALIEASNALSLDGAEW